MRPIRDFLEVYPNENTRQTYTTCLCKFLWTMYDQDPEPPRLKRDLKKYERLAENYFSELKSGDRNIRNDLLVYVSSLSTAAPITQKNYPSHVITWLEFHGFVIPPNERKQVMRRTRPSIPASEEEEHITHEVLRKILEFSPPQLRALVFVMSSSGLRIAEALALRYTDFDVNADPVVVHVRPETAKGGLGRKTFISSEARDVLVQWTQYRDQYIAAKRGPTYARNPKDPSVFPFTKAAAMDMWTNAVTKAGLNRRDRTTNRLTLHPHGLRKFFRRTLPTGGSNAKAVELTEKIMGHAGYLGGVYSRVPLSELIEFYRDAEHVLWINQPVAVRDPVVEERLERARKENEELRSRLQDIESTQIEWKSDMEDLKKYVKALKETENIFTDSTPSTAGTRKTPTRDIQDRDT